MKHPTEKYIQAITEGLLKIAAHPEKRAKYSIIIQSEERTDELFFYKNDPMISCAEEYALALCYALEITEKSTYEDVDESFKLSVEQIENIPNNQDACSAMWFLCANLKAFCEHNNDLEGVMDALEEILTAVVWTIHGAELCHINELKDIYTYFPEKVDAVNLISDIERYVSELPDDERYVDNVYDYITKACEDCPFIEDHQWLETALLQAYKVVDPPKAQRPKKNSFDQLYINAEKGDRESRHKLVEAYRKGIGVRANAQLADWWAQWD